MTTRPTNTNTNASSQAEEQTNAVKYFRAKNLSIFALFNVSKKDAADLLACMEYVDRDYHQKVNMSQFSEIFCPKWKHAFQSLWKRFVVTFDDSRNVDRGILATMKKNQKNEEEHFDFNATYVEALSFLFFIVSVEKRHSAYWLFWVWFTINDELPTKNAIVDIVGDLWGPDKKEESTKHRSAVKRAVRYMEVSDFDQKKFLIYDWKCGQAFTHPFMGLQKELLDRVANKKLWKRVLAEIEVVVDDPKVVEARLGEKKRPLGKRRSFRCIGERPDAWFELRDFIECFLRFHEMASTTGVEPTGLLEVVWSHICRVNAAIGAASTRFSGLFARSAPVEPVTFEFADDNCSLDDRSLTKKYKSALKLPCDRLFDFAERQREMAYNELEVVEEDLKHKIEYVDPKTLKSNFQQGDVDRDSNSETDIEHSPGDNNMHSFDESEDGG